MIERPAILNDVTLCTGCEECVAACPAKATAFGTREGMIAEAGRRIAERPDLYQPRIWGVDEVGGTSVLYVSHVDLAMLGWRPPSVLGNEPLPERTWDALRQVPYVFFGMCALMTGVWWIIDRRQRLAGAEGPRGESPGDGTAGPARGGAAGGAGKDE